METRHAADEPEPVAAPEPQWRRRVPLLPEQWWGPPLALAVGALAVTAIGSWLQGSVLPVAFAVGAVGLVGASVLAVVGRRTYWYPSRAAAWLLHRTRVVVWSTAAAALVVSGIALGVHLVVLGAVAAATIGSSMRRDGPTRFELRGRSLAAAAVAVASAVLAVVGSTGAVVDGALAARWWGWGVVIVPVAAVLAVLQWRAASRADDSAFDDAPLSAPDRTGS